MYSGDRSGDEHGRVCVPGTARGAVCLQAPCVPAWQRAIGACCSSPARQLNPASDAGLNSQRRTPSATPTAGHQFGGQPLRWLGGGLQLPGHLLHAPQQLQVAYGNQAAPSIAGIDGQGEDHRAARNSRKSRVNPPWVTDMRQDMAGLRQPVPPACPRGWRVDSTPGRRPAPPGWPSARRVLDVEDGNTRSRPDATLVILLLPTNSPGQHREYGLRRRRRAAPGQQGKGGVMSISAASQIGGEHCVTPRAQGRQREHGTPDGRPAAT